MTAFKGAKTVMTDIAWIQKTYISRTILSQPAFNIQSRTVDKRKELRLAIVISVSTRRRLIIEARTDIIDYPYFIVLDLSELNRQR